MLPNFFFLFSILCFPPTSTLFSESTRKREERLYFRAFPRSSDLFVLAMGAARQKSPPVSLWSLSFTRSAPAKFTVVSIHFAHTIIGTSTIDIIIIIISLSSFTSRLWSSLRVSLLLIKPSFFYFHIPSVNAATTPFVPYFPIHAPGLPEMKRHTCPSLIPILSYPILSIYLYYRTQRVFNLPLSSIFYNRSSSRFETLVSAIRTIEM